MAHKLPTPGRLEAFSDGVIAVIITIMVLELKVPRENGFAGLRPLAPVLLVYALSFTFTGIYWINHHYLVDRIGRANHRILYANLLFLFFLSLLPFFTSWTIEKNFDSASVVIYAVSLIATGLSFFALRHAIDFRLREEGTLAEESASEERKHVISLLLYLIAIPLAFFHPHVALADLALVTLVWILPGAAVRTRRRDGSSEGIAGSKDHEEDTSDNFGIERSRNSPGTR